MLKQPLRRLPLEGTRNTRDMGGYACPGGMVRWGAFVRSDNPARLTENDLAYLRVYGVRHVVDLRREEESAATPSALAGAKGFTVHHISLGYNGTMLDYEGDVPGSMAGLYIHMLDESQQAVAQVMRSFAEAEGGVLFHCMVGKDRTGVIALLLHKLAGVADADAITDYATTEVYMNQAIEGQLKAFGAREVPDFILHSRPASAQRVLAHLQQAYGGVEDYLLGTGLAQSELDILRGKLVQPLG